MTVVNSIPRSAKCVNILPKVTVASLRIILNIDGTPVVSRSHTHPSHSQTSRPLTSSLSLGVPVPRVTQCIFRCSSPPRNPVYVRRVDP
jgi:hypothetical protein